MEKIVSWIRRSVSPVFVVLLIASFILWYIAKLSYTYTTDQVMRLNVEGNEFQITCVVAISLRCLRSFRREGFTVLCEFFGIGS